MSKLALRVLLDSHRRLDMTKRHVDLGRRHCGASQLLLVSAVRRLEAHDAWSLYSRIKVNRDACAPPTAGYPEPDGTWQPCDARYSHGRGAKPRLSPDR